MLNLQKPLEYTLEEQTHVENVLKPQGKRGWDDQKELTKKIKNRLCSHALRNQEIRCAYCESPLRKGGVHLEHFIPKALLGNFTYEPFNLFVSCPTCNAPGVKNEKGIIVPPANNKVYEMNVFKIVHPYLHNPEENIKFIDADKLIFDKTKCTPLGLATIDFFQWDSSASYDDRVMNSKTRNIPRDIIKLINEISTYKT